MINHYYYYTRARQEATPGYLRARQEAPPDCLCAGQEASLGYFQARQEAPRARQGLLNVGCLIEGRDLVLVCCWHGECVVYIELSTVGGAVYIVGIRAMNSTHMIKSLYI
jgi:hypothetical protein